MTRIVRAFLVTYAAAMIAVSLGPYLHRSGDSETVEAVFLSAVSLSYLVLALGFLTGKNLERMPARPWLATTYVLALAPPAVTLLLEDAPSHKELGTSVGCALAFLIITTLVLADVRFDGVSHYANMRRWLVPAAILAGAALVCSSLLGNTTYSDPGWKIVTRRAPWITSEVNVASPLFSGHAIEWLQPIYKPGGYFFYLLGLASTLILLVWAFASRMSIEHLQSSRIISRIGALIIFTSFWVQTDIYWAWHFNLSNVPWAAVTATSLWLAGPLFGGFLLAPVFRGMLETSRMRTFLVTQLPVAAFNFLMLFAYGEEDGFHMAGLGMLIVGLQLESWACMSLLSRRIPEPAVKEMPVKGRHSSNITFAESMR